jgi:hypothetical protein
LFKLKGLTVFRPVEKMVGMTNAMSIEQGKALLLILERMKEGCKAKKGVGDVPEGPSEDDGGFVG